MISGAHHKMYDYEVAPPPGTWEKIEAELDESELSQKFPSRLYNSQVAPPASAWAKIAMALDEPLLVQDYAAKLSGIEIAPPAAAWGKIKTSLEENSPQRRIPAFLKYAAAAAVIGLMVWGGISLVNTNKNNTVAVDTNPAAEHPVTPGQEAISGDEGEIALSDVNAAMDEARNDAALEASKKTFAKLDISASRTKVKNAADFFFISEDDEFAPTGQSRGLDYEEPQDPTPPVELDLTNRYIVLMTPDGNIIRMSKKLRDLVCCVSGEEVDKDCVDQMKKWREKIANPAATHTPGNFLDLLHMLNSLQDK